MSVSSSVKGTVKSGPLGSEDLDKMRKFRYRAWPGSNCAYMHD